MYNVPTQSLAERSVVRDSDYHKHIEYYHIPYIDSMFIGHEIVARATVSIQGLLFQFNYWCLLCVPMIIFTIHVNQLESLSNGIYSIGKPFGPLVMALPCNTWESGRYSLGPELFDPLDYHIVSFPGWCDMGMRLPMPLYSFLFQARVHKNGRLE